MILVRRRRRIVDRLVRALKDAGVPVAGVDRLVLTQQLSVMDLVALANFLLLPDDDLTLATVLKGPLIGFDDDDLFELAFDRGERSLWQIWLLAQRRSRNSTKRAFGSATCWPAPILSRPMNYSPVFWHARRLTAKAVGKR